MKTQDVELLKETVINLIIENTKLKKDLLREKESSMLWFEKFKELEDLNKNQEEESLIKTTDEK